MWTHSNLLSVRVGRRLPFLYGRLILLSSFSSGQLLRIVWATGTKLKKEAKVSVGKWKKNLTEDKSVIDIYVKGQR